MLKIPDDTNRTFSLMDGLIMSHIPLLPPLGQRPDFIFLLFKGL